MRKGKVLLQFLWYFVGYVGIVHKWPFYAFIEELLFFCICCVLQLLVPAWLTNHFLMVTSVADGSHKWNCAAQVLHQPADVQVPSCDAGRLLRMWQVSSAQWKTELLAWGICSVQCSIQLLHHLRYYMKLSCENCNHM